MLASSDGRHNEWVSGSAAALILLAASIRKSLLILIYIPQMFLSETMGKPMTGKLVLDHIVAGVPANKKHFGLCDLRDRKNLVSSG